MERLVGERLLEAEASEEEGCIAASTAVGALRKAPAPALSAVDELAKRSAVVVRRALDGPEDEKVVVQIYEGVGNVRVLCGGPDVRDAVPVLIPALPGRNRRDASYPPGRIAGDPDSIVG